MAWKLAYSKLSLPRLGWLSTFRPATLPLTSWVPHQASNSGQPWRSLASRSTKRLRADQAEISIKSAMTIQPNLIAL
ncbi:hypothetical protein HU230_0016250 [Bradyrhizobium quebecense]|nr:hypothetical protein [Bradyrhizobium quebecense]UGA47494.1 hypothetical protein HU230_0016250 [Bradyrhizobium quebecense]